MTVRQLQTAALFALFSAPALLLAQEISSAEEQRLEALARAQAELYIPRNTVTVGFRLLNKGTTVHFGNLGNVPFATTQAPLTDGAVKRTYDNGFVDVDAPRVEETNGDGVQTSTPGGRYKNKTTLTTPVTDADGNVVGSIVTVIDASDKLSYTPGLTRVWSYSTPAQAELRPGYIAMSSYSAISDGSAFDKAQGPIGGVELQFARMLGKATGRMQWSLSAGISLNDINSKSNRDISATLRTVTDFYSLNGLPAPDTSVAAPYTAPSNPTGVLEDTVPISSAPVDHTDTATAGGATVHGKYQVKGSYFLLKFGPAIHTQLTERVGLSASLGLAGAYSGTRYTAVEKIDVPDMGTTISTANPEVTNASKFLTGYYADFNVEFATNETTSLFGGITAQRLSAYEQMVGTRTAKIDIGSAVGVRGGISIRF